ncbi:MAG: response regulator [Deltaproteobacteria bacterium]|nr:response regulator [Deltaproteobacteria bacterium]
MGERREGAHGIATRHVQPDAPLELRGATIRLGFRAKLVILITAAILVTGLLLVAYNFSRSRRGMEGELRKRGEVVAASLADAARPLLVAGAPALAELCASFARQVDVAYVLISDDKGKLIAHVVNPGFGPRDLQLIGERAKATVGRREGRVETLHLESGDLRAVTAPIFVRRRADAGEGDEAFLGMEDHLLAPGSGVSVGADDPGEKTFEALVEVGISLRSLRKLEEELISTGAGIIAMVALLGLALAMLIANLMVRPLNQVAAASDAIAAGDLSIRLRTRPQGDEINKLAVFFNRMTEVLQRQREEVTELTRELMEQRDQERALRDMAVTTSSASSVTGLLEGLFADMARVVGSHAVVFYAPDEATGQLIPVAARSIALSKCSPLELGEGIVGTAAATRTRVVANGVTTLAVPIMGKSQLARGVAAQPIFFQERLVGVLEIATFDTLGPAHLEFLDAVSGQVAVALNNLMTHERTVELARELVAKKAELERQNLELADANQEIQRANEHKSAFLANMSHELRTPMNSIIGFTRLVLKKAGDLLPTQQAENLRKVERSAVSLLDIINDILDLSKIEAGKLDVTPRPFTLGELVDEIMASSLPLIGDKPLRLEKRLPASLPELCTDRTRVRQVILNLVSNAIKFTPRGEVRIEAEHRAATDRVLIHVVDTGIGISAADHDLVFQAFQQVDNTTTRKVGGTGLGLAIVKRLCELLGGAVHLESVEGQGSRFTVDIPRRLRPADEGGSTPASGLRSGPGQGPAGVGTLAAAVSHNAKEEGSRRRAVVIDDSPDDALLLREMLVEQGYEVLTAHDGQEGLRLLRELRPALCTVDIQMPGMDGLAVLKEIKSDPGLRDLPVVVVSILAQDYQSHERELGVRALVAKPITPRAIALLTQKENLN